MDDLFINDIALVKLTEPVELGRFVRTVCLPNKDEGDLVIPNKYGYAAGWGATRALKPGEQAAGAERYSIVLKYSSYTIQENRLCSNRSVLPFNSTVSFCAGDGKGGNGTCRGDGGERLFAKEEEVMATDGLLQVLSVGQRGAHKRISSHTSPKCIHLLTGLRKLSKKKGTQKTEHETFINELFSVNDTISNNNMHNWM